MADVIIVGAGLSGLVAAEKLVAAGKCWVKKVIFRGRWSGSCFFEGLKLGLDDKGMIVVSSPSGERKVFDPEDAKSAASAFSSKATKQLEAVVVQLDSMAAELDLTTPWSHPKADEWDYQTLHSWICAHLSDPEAVAMHLAQWRPNLALSIA
ncbi:NAD(P)-binding domain protein, partial [Metarhizium majus ARSEF 297]